MVAVIASLLFALAGVATATPLTAQGIDGPYLLQNYNGYCMDIGSNAPGTPVVMAGCGSHLTSQIWYRVRV